MQFLNKKLIKIEKISRGANNSVLSKVIDINKKNKIFIIYYLNFILKKFKDAKISKIYYSVSSIVWTN